MIESPINILVIGGESKVARLMRRHCLYDANFSLVFQSRNELAKSDVYWDPLKSNSNFVYKTKNDIKFDALLNLAGPTQNQNAHLNAEIAFNCCILADRLSIPKVFLASSAAVYGIHQTRFLETDCCSPVNLYGEAKLKMENSCFAGSFNTNVLGLRMGNFVGADSLSLNVLTNETISLDISTSNVSGLRSYLGPLSFLRILRSLIEDTTLHNRPINIANPRPFRMQEFLDKLKVPYYPKTGSTFVYDIELDVNLLKSVHKFKEYEYSVNDVLSQVDWNLYE